MGHPFVELLKANADHARSFHDRFDDVQDAQHPDVVSVCCADSRVLGDHLWGNDDPGAVFSVANAGNRVVQRTDAGTVVSGDVLYPVEHTGTETVVVVGHTGCGAVTATYGALAEGDSSSTAEPPGIDHCIGLLKPHVEPGVAALPDGLERVEAINRLVEFNVDRQVSFLLDSEDVPDDVDVFGVVYDFRDAYGGRRGELHVVNANGETDPETLRAAHPEIRSRIGRIWEY